MIDLLIDAVLDVLKDGAMMVPFLLGSCLLIEIVSHSQGKKIQTVLSRGGKFGFLLGGLLGCIPQCGFSAMSAELYSARVISLGTMLAIFISTSDEAVPMLVANPEYWPVLLKLIAVKIVMALIAGFTVDVLIKKIRQLTEKKTVPVKPQEKFVMKNFAVHQTVSASKEPGKYMYLGGQPERDDGDYCCSCGHHHGKGIFMGALRHTAELLIYILIFSLAIEVFMTLFGEEKIQSLLQSLKFFQPVAAALVGLIPSCAVSVLLIELYMSGAISFGSVVAGLASSAGVGLIVLYRTSVKVKKNILITFWLFAFGAISGILLQLSGL